MHEHFQRSEVTGAKLIISERRIEFLLIPKTGLETYDAGRPFLMLSTHQRQRISTQRR